MRIPPTMQASNRMLMTSNLNSPPPGRPPPRGEPLYGKMDECGRSLFFTLSGTFLLSFAGDQDTADDAGQQQ